MRRPALALLALMAAPAFAGPPPAAYLERQQVAAADEAGAATAKTARPSQTTSSDAGAAEAKERCRVVRQWTISGIVVRHDQCEGAPKPDAPGTPAVEAAAQR